MSSAILAGSTGLLGSHILATLISHPAFTSISAYSRRKLPSESPKVTILDSADSETWPSMFPKASTNPSIFFSSLGTTKAQAGSVSNQRKIDIDLNLALAKAAKDAGTDIYVLISTASASATSRIAYSAMKGELEDKVKELGFKHTVILRAGLIVGEREDSRPVELIARKVAALLPQKLKDPWAQDAELIAKAAVSAGIQCLEGKKEEGVCLLAQADIVRLGRTEWKLPESR